MLNRRQLEIINRQKLKYPLAIAEKDYFLALVLQIISQSSLGGKLIFKGGTAIHHCYLEQGRFSEDLDFSSNQNPVDLKEVEKIFAQENYLEIKKDYASGATIKIEKLQYLGPLFQPNSLKIEIDFLQNVILPAQNIKYQNIWGLDFNVPAMDAKEICAEKIRAASDRARHRDFYDLFLLLEKYHFDLAEILELVKKKEIRKPITKNQIKNNWKIINTQKEAEMSQIYYSRQINDGDIERMINDLPFIEIKK